MDNLQDIWQVETDLLKRLLDVCERHNLRVLMCGGSLLGVVRHKGFIPWDDDIDVWMPRPDYDRLLKIGPEEFKLPYFFQSAYSDKDYYRGHAQIRRSDTAAIRPSDVYQPFNQGIFIDVFPVDGVPEDEKELDEILRKFRRGMRFLKAANTNILMQGRLTLVFRKWKARRAIRKKGWQTLYRETEDLLRRTPYDSSKRVGSLASDGKRLIFDRSLYDVTYGEFQGLRVPIPVGWKTMLAKQYGDNFMTPIRMSSTHGHVVFDTQRSYTEVLPEARRDYRRSALKRLWNKITHKK